MKMIKDVKKNSVHYKPLQLVYYMTGIIFMPLGVIFTINAHLGAGGYDALNFAIADRFSINTSYAIYITAVIALVVTAFIRRSFPRVTTFISSFLIGLMTDFWKRVCTGMQQVSMTISVLMLLTGIAIIGFSVASYMLSALPTNPTDDLIVACKERGWSIRLTKVTMDIICLSAAFILGGEIGIGTIVVTVILGPVIDGFYHLMSKAEGSHWV